MLAIFLAMLFIGGAIWLSSYIVSQSAIRSSLDNLVQSEELVLDTSISDHFDDPRITEAFSSNIRDVIEYWVIRYDETGELLSVNGRYSEKSEGFLLSISDEIRRGTPGNGHRGRIYYKYVEDEHGSTVAFIDATTEINALTRLFYIALIVCTAGLAVTYILVVHFSDYIVASEVENFARQNDFITNASHELKTPLAVIRANTEMSQMLNGEDEWSSSTLKQVDHMNGLIANLVMISKAQEMEDKTVMAVIDASEVVESSVKSFEPVASQEGLTLSTQITPEVSIKADASKIMQLTTLLVDNAIKYCDKGGIVRVELTQIRKGAVRLTVSNSYKDGANVDYNKFFDRFYREDKSHNIDKGGYGIGLSIAENICRQYSGSINASWKNGEISFICQLY
ncbi:MAG: HAMP domain-containing histidine kinase [Clostridiales bacterium]|nr:HAMP domain-containing histidine kinase [Clostridiales bacterium]